MFETLSKRLQGPLKAILGLGVLTERNVEEGLLQVRSALFDADIDYDVLRQFVADTHEAVFVQNVLNSVHARRQIVKIVGDELVKMMGGQEARLRLARKPPTTIMMVGLQCQGKTTSAGKLAFMLKRKGHKCLLVRLGVHRFGTARQLEVIAQQAGSEFFGLGEHADLVDTCAKVQGEAQTLGCDVIILDTAGHSSIDEEMTDEVRRIHAAIRPHEVLFVANAMTGQEAVRSVKQFHEVMPVTGVVLTQTDRDAEGGAALSLVPVTGCPIKFIGTGERLHQFDVFHPSRMAGQILGMGYIASRNVSLVERTQDIVDKEQVLRFQERARKAGWDLDDFLQQMQQVKKMGSMQDLLKGIPGFSKMLPAGTYFDEDELKYTEAVLLSMTVKERRDPKVIDVSRCRRIAEGSGTTVQEVSRLLRDFYRMKRVTGE